MITCLTRLDCVPSAAAVAQTPPHQVRHDPRHPGHGSGAQVAGWKIQEICSKMGTKFFEIDEEMSEIIDAKVGNSQNSTSIKSANLSQP